MKDKEKQIEEMAIAEMIQKYLNNNNIKVSNSLLPLHIASILIDNNYQKVDKNSVVMTREEYETWFKKDGYFLGYRDGENSAVNYYENVALPSKEQETAEKILNEVSKHYGGAWLVELYKKFGVEIKE